MNTITAADLNTTLDVEPRVSHVQIANALGYAQHLKMRHLIERNSVEFQRYGALPSTVDGTTGGRPAQVIWLNEGQALLAAVRSETRRAADVRQQVITVFMEHRRGHRADASTANDLLARLEQLLDINERAKKIDVAIAMVDDMRRRNDAHSADLARTAAGIRRLLAGPAVQPIGEHVIRRVVDGRDRRRVGMRMLADGFPPEGVAKELGVTNVTAKRWAVLLEAQNDN